MDFEKLEKMAFKNKTKLSKLDKPDLLAIIEFLELDRKSWFDQFTKTHNESIDIAKQNQKYKKTIDKIYDIINYEYEFYDDITEMKNDIWDILKEVK